MKPFPRKGERSPTRRYGPPTPLERIALSLNTRPPTHHPSASLHACLPAYSDKNTHQHTLAREARPSLWREAARVVHGAEQRQPQPLPHLWPAVQQCDAVHLVTVSE
jgi:hypothetical protein